MLRYGGVFFDLDGTLLYTIDDLGGAANAALTDMGLPPHPLEVYPSMIGHGMRHLCRMASQTDDDAIVDVLLRRIQREYADRMVRTSRAFPGVHAMLRSLRLSGIAIGVVSNKDHDLTVEIVRRVFADAGIQAVLGAHGSRNRKPAPDALFKAAEGCGLRPSEILYVGDSTVDVQAARAANMDFAGVSWGYQCPQTLRKAGAQTVLEAPADLVGLVDR